MTNVSIVNRANDEVHKIMTRNKTNTDQDKMLFVRGMLACRKFVETNQRILKNDNYSKIYKFVYRMRKKLKIPGSTCDLVPREYIDVYDYIPECLFEKDTKEERLNELEKVTEKLTNVNDLVTFVELIKKKKS